jgi:hypothetical protein
MSDPTRKFKFISPGVFIDEIDNSQLPAVAAPIGPVIIGRTAKGPAMRPVTVSSMSEFIEVFGAPQAGGGGGDIWRDGNETAPTYASYAAQAWLRNSGAVTMMRLLGEEDPDASTAGKAGWKVGTTDTTVANGGAWGLFIFPSSSVQGLGAMNATLSGTLAATFYCSSGRVALSGNDVNAVATASACTLIGSDANKEFTMSIFNSSGTEAEKMKFSFTETSDRYIRKVFNTNPTLTNAGITSTSAQKTYFLGESFASKVGGTFNEVTVAGSIANIGSYFGVVLPMQNIRAQTQELNDRRYASRKSTTGWFIGQDLTNNFASWTPSAMQKLFRFESLSAGREAQESFKISITDIKKSTNSVDNYGTFSVLIRALSDTDNTPRILERFSNISLNPASTRYIGRLIGDKYVEYDSTEKRNRWYGQHLNRSNYVRVVMNEDVDRGVTDALLLPFGAYGAPKGRDVNFASGSQGWGAKSDSGVIGSEGASVHSLIDGGTDFGLGGSPSIAGIEANILIHTGDGLAADTNFGGTFHFPAVPLRKLNTWASPKSAKNVFWGAYTGKSATDGKLSSDVVDMLRSLPAGLESNDVSTSLDIAGVWSGAVPSASPIETSWVFSLDNVGPVTSKEKESQHSHILRTGGTSFSSGAHLVNGSIVRTDASASYAETLKRGADKFTTCLHGGFDGIDITERDPFANRNITGTDETANYELHTLKRAINVIRDSEEVEFNLATIPGITNTGVTQHLLDVVEARGDALAILDLGSTYDADTESASSFKARNSYTVTQAVDGLRDRNINSSYGACYYPWVRIQDTISGQSLWAPPSIPALGALSRTDRVAAPWFAPAGFTRGGLSEGAAGIPVLDVSRRLSSDDRDDLYEANINPIAQFPAEGIVIYGQKTLQTTASALDRINVRRLLVHIKREISRIAATMIFEQNTQATWNRFLGQAEPLLRSIQARFGLEDFRLVLDETSTTPDMIDRNIIYAKCLLKPTRSVEFFAIDFVVTNSGASFED